MSLATELRDLRLRVHALEEQAEGRFGYAPDADPEDVEDEDDQAQRAAEELEQLRAQTKRLPAVERELAEARAELAAQQRNHLSVVAALVAQIDGWKAKAEQPSYPRCTICGQLHTDSEHDEKTRLEDEEESDDE